MLTGYNTDFKFQGKIYHVQTEDGGSNSPFITSLLYHQGAILSSRKTSYADILKADCLEEVVRELMMEQHKHMIRDLMQGKLEIHAAPREASSYSSPSPKVAPAAKEAPAVPGKEKEPVRSAPVPNPPDPKAEEKEKSLDDIILDFLAQEQKEGSRKK
ncbi:MAG TPA: hypothetical protein VL122_13080 [Nitrospirota bacterium]|nr:hypothetical protein [Nitrospirota bacterium]